MARSTVNHAYLDFEYLTGLLRRKSERFEWYEGQELTEPVTFLGLYAPEGLPDGSTAVTLSNLQKLIPA